MTRYRKSRPTQGRDKRWILSIDSREAAVNLYSILLAFQKAEDGGLVARDVAGHIDKWLATISQQVPDVEKLAGDTRGPFRERDTSRISASLELDAKEREVVLFICKTIYNQLTTPKMQQNWIENQGQADYELAVRNYRAWIASLEGEATLPNKR